MNSDIKRIAIIDDEKSFLNSIKRMLFEFEDYHIMTFDSPQHVLDLLKEDIFYFSIILSDEKMPGISGTDFIRIINEEYPHIVTMIMTGYPSFESSVKAINSGNVFKYLIKPIAENTLLSALKMASIESDLRKTKYVEMLFQKMHLKSIQKLESQYPGITKVKKDKMGSVIIDEEDTNTEIQ